MVKLQALVTFTEQAVHFLAFCVSEYSAGCATLCSCTLRETFSVELRLVSALQFLHISPTLRTAEAT